MAIPSTEKKLVTIGTTYKPQTSLYYINTSILKKCSPTLTLYSRKLWKKINKQPLHNYTNLNKHQLYRSITRSLQFLVFGGESIEKAKKNRVFYTCLCNIYVVKLLERLNFLSKRFIPYFYFNNFINKQRFFSRFYRSAY